MRLIDQKKVIALAANSQLKAHQIRLDEIEATQFEQIRKALGEDLYDEIIADKFSTETGADFTIDISSFDILTAYSTGLSIIGGGNKAITVINYTNGQITAVAHGLSTDDEIYIDGVAKDANGNDIDELNKKLQYNEFKVTKVDNDIITLTSNIVNDYLKPPLAFYVFHKCFDRIWVELSDRGAGLLNTEGFSTVSKATRKSYKENLIKTADSLLANAIDYIYKQEYTNYGGYEGDEEEYLETVKALGNKIRTNRF